MISVHQLKHVRIEDCSPQNRECFHNVTLSTSTIFKQCSTYTLTIRFSHTVLLSGKAIQVLLKHVDPKKVDSLPNAPHFSLLEAISTQEISIDEIFQHFFPSLPYLPPLVPPTHFSFPPTIIRHIEIENCQKEGLACHHTVRVKISYPVAKGLNCLFIASTNTTRTLPAQQIKVLIDYAPLKALKDGSKRNHFSKLNPPEEGPNTAEALLRELFPLYPALPPSAEGEPEL